MALTSYFFTLGQRSKPRSLTHTVLRKYSGLHLKKLIDENFKTFFCRQAIGVSRSVGNIIYSKYGLDKLFLYIGSEVKAQVTDPYSIKNASSD